MSHSDASHSVLVSDLDQAALVGQKLTLPAFQQLAGVMAGYPFVKVVVERAAQRVHFINGAKYAFHADYIAERIMGISRDELRADIDTFNKKVYLSPDRPYYLCIISLHRRREGQFFALETVEIDNMDGNMLMDLFRTVERDLDGSLPLFFKPANHGQEATVAAIDPVTLPRMYNYQLFSENEYVPLNSGETVGRLRVFSESSYQAEVASLRWFDIIAMERVPDNIPRLSGIINAHHTTPLSHTNVLACGWQIPNAVQIGALKMIAEAGLDGAWVRYVVDPKANAIKLEKVDRPADIMETPRWNVQHIRLEEPETEHTPIAPLTTLRMRDRYRYGTKAANLGELTHVLAHGSTRLIGFYRVPRPPRANLLSYLASLISSPNDSELGQRAGEFLRHSLEVPRGIALPFALQREFLESSPKIQQALGKLKMALELNAKEIDALCLLVQNLIRQTRISDSLRDRIDDQIATHLGGVRSFVVRSSSNAEDLKNFSAAGIYESINHVTDADRVFESIKEVWASLVSPRSVRLRHEVGIALDDSYMGVVIQEEVKTDMGGVMVTTNPMNVEHDFRNVYVNASDKSAVEVVSGQGLPFQYLYNTLEGGGRTLSIGSSAKDLDEGKKRLIQTLAICGRLLQSHFSEDYTFSKPVDIEWAADGKRLYILQLRPYAI